MTKTLQFLDPRHLGENRSMTLRIGSLFSGYGGLDMACEAYFSGRTVWHSDIDPGANRILAHRYPDIPNIGDLTKVDWSAVEPVDVLTGGFPCQDVSHAGKRAGLRPDTRSGLWTHMAYAVSQLRPRYVIAENVRGLLSARAASDVEPCPWCLGGAADGEPDLRALGAVLGDLAELGYDARWHGLHASDIGGPHGRFRVFILASTGHADSRHLYGRPSAGQQGKARPPTRPAATAQDTDCAASGERRLAASGQAEAGWPWADTGRRGGAPATDADLDELKRERHEQPRRAVASGSSAGAPADANDTADDGERSRSGSRVGSASAADAGSQRHGGGEDGRALGSVDGGAEGEAPQREWARSEPGDRGTEVAWGVYEAAIRRWEAVLGRVAPAPTETSPRGSQRLSPAFVEWMMGLPAGHVTQVPGLNRNAQFKALGNGVVPQQAYAALQVLFATEAAAA